MIESSFDIIDKIESSKLSLRLKEVKRMIKEDEKIINLLNEFNKAKEEYQTYGISDKYKLLKQKLMCNKIVKEYLTIQNQINLLSLHINMRMKSLIKTTCK